VQRIVTAIFLVGLGITACGGPARPTPQPTRSPLIGVDWATVPDVERPADTIASTQPSDAPRGTDTAGHPGHPAGQAHMQAVTSGSPGLVAVGHVVPGVRAAAWTSIDGRSWRQVPEFPVADDSPLLAVAAGPRGTPVVAVGSEGGIPLALVTDDRASSWQKQEFVVEGGRFPIQVAAVAAGASGPDAFVAGGWAGAPNERPDTRLWHSPDGFDWRPSTIGPTSEDGRVLSIAAGARGYVAVGQTGPEGDPTGAAVWTSADGREWTRLAEPALPGRALLEAVTATSAGFVAVGSTIDRSAAIVWLSSDGTGWTAAAAGQALGGAGGANAPKVRMRAVTTGGEGVVAVEIGRASCRERV